MAKTARTAHHQPMGFNGDTWDARHMSSFLSQSHYSNWRGEQKNISRVEPAHRRTFSHKGDHFFKTTRQDNNQSKIGCTPIFPLVSNAPLHPAPQRTLAGFFESKPVERGERVVSGRSVKLRCSPEEKFKFEGNAMKFQSTDPLTMQHQARLEEKVSGYQRERMNRLIEKRHPHGMTGIDHPDNPESKHYAAFE